MRLCAKFEMRVEATAAAATLSAAATGVSQRNVTAAFYASRKKTRKNSVLVNEMQMQKCTQNGNR